MSSETTYNTRAVVLSLVVGVFFGGMVGGVAFPTLPQLGTVLGFSALVVGVILSINRFTRMVLNAPAGSILDRFGTRRPMLAVDPLATSLGARVRSASAQMAHAAPRPSEPRNPVRACC